MATQSKSTRSPARSSSGHAQGKHGAMNPAEIAAGVIIGRTSEFFDFFVYAIASVLVFPKLVFPYTDALTGTLYSFAVFSLAFVARPLGTLIFTEVDRIYGRGVKLTIALFMLGTSTVAMAFLPGHEQVGSWSVFMLSLFRVGQGMALGGGWSGLASLLAMNAPKDRRGWYAMIPQLGAPLGLMAASGLFAYFVGNLSNDDFMEWGWRYPFFVAFAINVVALFARLRIVSTKEYTELFENHELHPASVVETVRAEGSNVVIGAFAPMASFALFHMVTVFPLSWVFLFTKHQPAHFLVVECLCSIFGIASIIISGVLADRFGRRLLLGATAGAIAAYSGFAPQLLNGGTIHEIVFMVLGFILLGISFGQSSGAMASNFSSNFRFTGSALTSDCAWLAGAGFAPLIALILSSQFGLMMAGVYLLVGAFCTLIALAISGRFAVQND